jgi:hypothetical protein
MPVSRTITTIQGACLSKYESLRITTYIAFYLRDILHLTGEIRNACKIFIEKPKIHLGCLRWRWENNVKTDLKENKLSPRDANSNKKDVAEMTSARFCWVHHCSQFCEMSLEITTLRLRENQFRSSVFNVVPTPYLVLNGENFTISYSREILHQRLQQHYWRIEHISAGVLLL